MNKVLTYVEYLFIFILLVFGYITFGELMKAQQEVAELKANAVILAANEKTTATELQRCVAAQRDATEEYYRGQFDICVHVLGGTNAQCAEGMRQLAKQGAHLYESPGWDWNKVAEGRLQ